MRGSYDNTLYFIYFVLIKMVLSYISGDHNLLDGKCILINLVIYYKCIFLCNFLIQRMEASIL